MRRFSIVAVYALVAGCVSLPHRQAAPDGVAHVNPASIAAERARWDGRQVEVVGLLVYERENLGLYQDYGTYCRAGEKTAIFVQWSDWPGVSRADNRRLVMVRGTFRNKVGVRQPDGTILISNGAPGPGPLEPGALVRRLSKPRKPCPPALP